MYHHLYGIYIPYVSHTDADHMSFCTMSHKRRVSYAGSRCDQVPPRWLSHFGATHQEMSDQDYAAQFTQTTLETLAQQAGATVGIGGDYVATPTADGEGEGGEKKLSAVRGGERAISC